MVVYPAMIGKRVMENLPFMATEAILMEGVRLGGDRQELHERIRVHSQAAAARMKQEGKESDLMERIAADPAFPMDHEHLTKLLSPENYTGRAAEQTVNFVKNEVDPALAGHDAREMGEIKL